MSHREAEIVFQFILGRLKIQPSEDFRYLRQNSVSILQDVLVLLLEHLRHLQAGDSGNGLAADFLDIDKDLVHIFSTPFESR